MLAVDDRDAGCEATCEALERYVDCGRDVDDWVDGITVHLSRCRACRTDYDGLVAVTRHQLGRGPDL